ncbi:hypothetical protein Psi01_32330 [Planobispora siamensis]|uniref:Uncharacterized protein n=1 Tax=Planobispora siamensis TaxID=936338 RepID=A0A8J3SEA2_9ACTN|nr:hypothetical protein Psi01_32330 [Planobispora siamensis]
MLAPEHAAARTTAASAAVTAPSLRARRPGLRIVRFMFAPCLSTAATRGGEAPAAPCLPDFPPPGRSSIGRKGESRLVPGEEAMLPRR